MSQAPQVSIIVPLYNRVDLIGETINSVLKQTFNNWELIIVDDGSTDGSYEYIKSLSEKESRIKLSKRDRAPKGAPTCRNIGLDKARGDYVIYLDSDDLLASHCLEQRIEAMQQYSDHDFIVFPIQYFEKEAGDRQDIFFRYFYQDYITSFLLKSHWITMSPIWKKKALLELGGFDEQLTCMQDGDLHLRALIADMKFQVLRNAPVDGYLRSANNYDRISNRVDINKLRSKVLANEKMYELLSKKKMLTPVRERMITAHFLNISWNYQLEGNVADAKKLWKSTLDRGMINRWSYYVGQSFICVRSLPLIRDFRVLAGGIKRIHQLLLPKFLLWL